MEHDRRNPPNFLRMVEMDNSDGLIDIAFNTKTNVEFREAALIHLIYFYGRIPDDKIEGVLSALVKDSNEEVSGMAQDAHQVFDLVKEHTEEVDYIIDLIRNKKLGENVRIGVEMIAERHSEGLRKDEIASALNISKLRGGLEQSDEVFKIEEQVREMFRDKKEEFEGN